MSLIKDPRYVTNLSLLIGTQPVQPEACRLILAHTELRIRQVISEAVRFMTLFNREKLSIDDIETAIRDLRLEEYQYDQPFTNFKIPEHNPEDPSLSKLLYFKNEPKDIDQLERSMLASMSLKPSPKVSLDWLQIDNKIPYTAANVQAKTLKGQASTKGLSIQSTRKKELPGILIKEPQGSSVSKEVGEFLQSYFALLEKQEEEVDNGGSTWGKKEYLNLLGVVGTMPGVEGAIPWLLGSRGVDGAEYNGAAKRNLQNLLLGALLQNPLLPLGPLRHTLVATLLHALTSPRLSIQNNSDTLILRNQAALLLAKVLANNDDYASPKLRHSLFTLLSKQLLAILERPQDQTLYSVASGILRFFSYMDSKAILVYLYDVVIEYISLVESGKISYYPSSRAKGEQFASTILFEPFMSCVARILDLVYIEDASKSLELYDKLFERLGESILPLAQHTLLQWNKHSPCPFPRLVQQSPLLAEHNYFI